MAGTGDVELIEEVAEIRKCSVKWWLDFFSYCGYYEQVDATEQRN